MPEKRIDQCGSRTSTFVLARLANDWRSFKDKKYIYIYIYVIIFQTLLFCWCIILLVRLEWQNWWQHPFYAGFHSKFPFFHLISGFVGWWNRTFMLSHHFLTNYISVNWPDFSAVFRCFDQQALSRPAPPASQALQGTGAAPLFFDHHCRFLMILPTACTISIHV